MTTGESTPPAGADTGATPPAAPPAGGTPPGGEGTPPQTPPATPDGGAGIPPSSPSSASGDYKIPDEYKDEPWASKVKSESDLWKQVKNLQGLVGKKSIPPDLSKATPEEREAFYAQTRPADVAAYGLDKVSDEVMLPGVRAALGDQLLKNGVSPVQAQPILEAVAAASAKEREAAFNPENFMAVAESVMGKGYDPKPLNKIIKSNLSPEAYEGINNMPNVNLVAMHKAIKEIVDAYGIKETSAHTGASQAAASSTDVTTVRANLRAEIGKLIHRPHTYEEKQGLIKQLNDTYKTA